MRLASSGDSSVLKETAKKDRGLLMGLGESTMNAWAVEAVNEVK